MLGSISLTKDNVQTFVMEVTQVHVLNPVHHITMYWWICWSLNQFKMFSPTSLSPPKGTIPHLPRLYCRHKISVCTWRPLVRPKWSNCNKLGLSENQPLSWCQILWNWREIPDYKNTLHSHWYPNRVIHLPSLQMRVVLEDLICIVSF